MREPCARDASVILSVWGSIRALALPSGEPTSNTIAACPHGGPASIALLLGFSHRLQHTLDPHACCSASARRKCSSMAWMKPASHSSALGGLRSSIQKTDGCPHSRKRCACSNLKKPALITHAVHITGCGLRSGRRWCCWNRILLRWAIGTRDAALQHSSTPGFEAGFEVGWTAVNRGLGLRCKSKLPRVGRNESSLVIARTSARNTPRGCTLFPFEYLGPMQKDHRLHAGCWPASNR